MLWSEKARLVNELLGTWGGPEEVGGGLDFTKSKKKKHGTGKSPRSSGGLRQLTIL